MYKKMETSVPFGSLYDIGTHNVLLTYVWGFGAIPLMEYRMEKKMDKEGNNCVYIYIYNIEFIIGMRVTFKGVGGSGLGPGVWVGV